MRFPLLRSLFIVTCILLAATSPAQAQQAAPPSDYEAVRVPLENYLRAHATGNGSYIHDAFFPQARLFFIRQDTLRTLTVNEYASRFSGTPAEDEPQRRRWIASVDISGNSAIARIELDYPQARLTDYMSLLKRDGEWRIINKIFHSEPKPRPAAQ